MTTLRARVRSIIAGVSWTIGDDGTHVWMASTALAERDLARVAALLDDEERRRAAAFHFDSDRRLSLVARAALRVLLGRYLGRDPRALRFVAGAQGKPALAGGELEFNVSHSADHVAVAISATGPVGVDLEFERPTSDLLQLAGRFFAPREAEAIRAAPEDARVATFFTFWTAKESVIKAAGGGLSIDLRSFETTPTPGIATSVRNVTGNPRLDGWNVFVAPDVVAPLHLAVAAQHLETPRIRAFDFAESA